MTKHHIRPIIRRTLALLGMLLAAIAVGGPAGAVAAVPGVVTDLTWFPSVEQRVKTAEALKTAGSQWVRMDVGWHDFEPVQGVYSSWALTNYELEFQRARAAGQKIVLMVHTTPKWASGSDNMHAPPRDPQTYANFMRFLVQRYGAYIDAWEIWNEPNLARFWSTGPDPAKYTALLRAAYTAIKGVNPAETVVFGGLSTNDYNFVQSAYAAGAKGYFDVMATHPYSCAHAPETVLRYADGRITKGTFSAYREVRAIMQAQGDAKPIWFTEFGWTSSTGTCGVSLATQADYLTRAYRFVEQDPYVQVATWYSFRNSFWGGDADDPDDQYGLLRTDFSAKPSFEAFRQYAATLVNAAPTVRLTSPVGGGTFTTKLSFAATASDDRAVTKVRFLLDGKIVATDTTAPYSSVWTVPSTTTYAPHTVTAVAYDASGLTGRHSVVVTRTP